MNEELRTKWVEALRSGDHEQGNGALDAGGKRCCLGVLAHCAGRMRTEPYVSDYGSIMFATISGAIKVLGIDDVTAVEHRPANAFNTNLTLGGVPFEQSFFYSMNDNLGMTFAEIADVIEAENPSGKRNEITAAKRQALVAP